jgi:DNA primase
MSTSQPCSLSRTSEGLVFAGSTLAYRITGLTSYNLDRLYITLKASPSDPAGVPGVFHIDKLDLYNSRAREGYAEACVKYLKAQQGLVMAELSQIITALESERIAMREHGGAAVVASMSDAEKKEAVEALRSKDLLRRIVSDFDAIGYIGEKSNKALAYLAAVSRLLPEPLAVLILSRSGAGKTSLQNAVCKFVPPESVIQYTRLTGQSLFYRDQNALRNKVLAIEEEKGMQEAMYSVKTLISSQKLSVAATRSDPKTGKFSVDEYTVYGPVVVFVSTTRPDGLDDETKRRFLILTIDESEEQTRLILTAQRTKSSPRWLETTADETAVTKLHHNMQRMLKPLMVMIPDDLKITWPTRRLQYRGEHAKYYSLIKSIALLFQYQRKTGYTKRIDGTKTECVYATQKDVDLALEIGRAVFIRNVDDVPPTGRALLVLILKLVQEKYTHMKDLDPKRELNLYEIPFTRKELRDEAGWSETQIRVTCELLVELGYLGKLSGRHGSTYRYVLLDDGKDDPALELPPPPAAGTPVTRNQALIPQTSRVRTDFAPVLCEV